MMLSLNQDFTLQILTCFDQRCFRLRAAIRLEEHSRFSINKQLEEQGRIIGRGNFDGRRRVEYFRVYLSAEKERIATNQVPWFCFG